MKIIISLLVFILFSNFSYSQQDSTVVIDTKESVDVVDKNMYRVVKMDGGENIGKILSRDAREILLLTNDNRQIYIPQHVIKEIILINDSEYNSQGEFVGEDKFATRYFISTNGLPIKKGEHYIAGNPLMGEVQFGLDENFGVGVMTSIVGAPIIVNIKVSFELGPKAQLAVGGLLGTGSWISPNSGGALPFASLSFGNRSHNLAFSGGYGAVWSYGDTGGRAIISVAGMTKVAPKFSLVFDSFILLPGQASTSSVRYYDESNEKPGFALIMLGGRWHQRDGKALQMGIAPLFTSGETMILPMIQWYRSF